MKIIQLLYFKYVENVVLKSIFKSNLTQINLFFCFFFVFSFWGRLIQDFKGHSSFVNCFCLTHNNKELYSLEQDRTFKWWNTFNGRLNRTFSYVDRNSRSRPVAKCCVMSNLDDFIIFGASDGVLRKWSLKLSTINKYDLLFFFSKQLQGKKCFLLSSISKEKKSNKNKRYGFTELINLESNVFFSNKHNFSDIFSSYNREILCSKFFLFFFHLRQNNTILCRPSWKSTYFWLYFI